MPRRPARSPPRSPPRSLWRLVTLWRALLTSRSFALPSPLRMRIFLVPLSIWRRDLYIFSNPFLIRNRIFSPILSVVPMWRKLLLSRNCKFIHDVWLLLKVIHTIHLLFELIPLHLLLLLCWTKQRVTKWEGKREEWEQWWWPLPWMCFRHCRWDVGHWEDSGGCLHCGSCESWSTSDLRVKMDKCDIQIELPRI